METQISLGITAVCLYMIVAMVMGGLTDPRTCVIIVVEE